MGDMDIDSQLVTTATIVGAIVLALIIWRLRVVTFVGAIGIAVLGASIVLIGSWTFLIPLFVFFISSSILTILPGGLEEVDERRTLAQVIANGSVAWLAVLAIPLLPCGVWHHHILHAFFIGAIAAANADTWATEIGTRYGKDSRSIVSGRYVDPGTSGGITTIGTIAAALGALAVAATYPLLFPPTGYRMSDILIITGAGFTGSLVDSILGATLQKKCRCRRCGELVESKTHCGHATSVLRGFLTNDHVNWFCTIVGAVIAWWWVGK